MQPRYDRPQHPQLAHRLDRLRKRQSRICTRQPVITTPETHTITRIDPDRPGVRINDNQHRTPPRPDRLHDPPPDRPPPPLHQPPKPRPLAPTDPAQHLLRGQEPSPPPPAAPPRRSSSPSALAASGRRSPRPLSSSPAATCSVSSAPASPSRNASSPPSRARRRARASAARARSAAPARAAARDAARRVARACARYRRLQPARRGRPGVDVGRAGGGGEGADFRLARPVSVCWRGWVGGGCGSSAEGGAP